MLTVACLEIERPAQRYDQLHRGRLVPGERAAGSRLLKGDRLHRGLAAQQIAALTGLEVYGAFLEMRVSVVSSPYPNASNHVSTPFTLPLSRRIIRPGLPGGLGRPKGDDRFPINYPRQMPPGQIAEQFPELARGHLYVEAVGFDAKVSRFSEAMKSFIRFSEPTELQPIAARRPS
ncbi:MAG: hypothetical protein WAL59_14775 [Roseiarcus sp.]